MNKRNQKMQSKRQGKQTQSQTPSKNQASKKQKIDTYQRQRDKQASQEIEQDAVLSSNREILRIQDFEDFTQSRLTTQIQRNNRMQYQRRRALKKSKSQDKPNEEVKEKVENQSKPEKYGESQIFMLIKSVSDKNLRTRHIKSMYNHIFKFNKEQFSAYELKWYEKEKQSKTEYIRKKVRTEKERRMKNCLKTVFDRLALNCQNEGKPIPPDCNLTMQSLYVHYANSNTRQEFLQQLPQESIEDIENLRKALDLNFDTTMNKKIVHKRISKKQKEKKNELINENEEEMSLLQEQNIEDNVDENPVDEELKVDHIEHDISIEDVKPVDQTITEKSPRETEQIRRDTWGVPDQENSIDQEIFSQDPFNGQLEIQNVMASSVDPKDQVDADSESLKMFSQQNESPSSMGRIKQQPMKLFSNQFNSQFRLSVNKARNLSQTSSQNSLQNSINKFQQRASSLSYKEPKSQVFKTPLNIKRVTTNQEEEKKEKYDRLSSQSGSSSKFGQLQPTQTLQSQNSISQSESNIYEQVMQFYITQKQDMSLQNPQLTKVSLDGFQKLNALSKSKQNFIPADQWTMLIDLLRKFKSTYMKEIDQYIEGVADLESIYSLNSKSIFLQINSGNGAQCIHTAMIAQCTTYGIDHQLDSVLASIWLRSQVSTQLKSTSEEELELTLNKVQFVHMDLTQIERFSIGLQRELPATHIFYVEQDQQSTIAVCRILRNSNFAVLIWPFNQDETSKLLWNDRLEHKVEYAFQFYYKSKFYLGSKNPSKKLYIYYRKPYAELNQIFNNISHSPVPSLIKNNNHIVISKQNQVVVPILKLVKGYPHQWINWRLETLDVIKSSLKNKASNIAVKTPPKRKTPVQKKQQANEDQQIINKIKKELNDLFNKEFILGKAIYCSKAAVIFTTQIKNQQIVIKVSRKYFYANLLQEALIAEKIYNALPTSNRLAKYIKNGNYTIKIGKKDRKAEDKRHFIFYEYYPLRLEDLMNSDESEFRRNPEFLKYVFTEISLGVLELHQRNFAHCDLKSGNILLTKDKQPLISDFGLACEAITQQFQFKGSMYYIPKEYFNGKSLNGKDYDYRKADIWSLGVMLYRFFFKDYPFQMITTNDDIGFKICDFTTQELNQIFPPNLFPLPSQKLKMNLKSEEFINLDNLLRLMLNYDYTKRISISNVLGHDFLAETLKKINKKSINFGQDFDEKFNDHLLKITKRENVTPSMQ